MWNTQARNVVVSNGIDREVKRIRERTNTATIRASAKRIIGHAAAFLRKICSSHCCNQSKVIAPAFTHLLIIEQTAHIVSTRSESIR